jgi:DNA-binding transcriptional ArsR family regulator
MIEALYRLPAPDGALLLLSRLYDDVEDQTAIAAWEGGKTDLPPFCWRLAGGDYKPLQDALDRGRSAVTSHLAALTKLGVIRRKKRDGRSGWELLGTRRSSPATSGDPDDTVRGSGRSGPKILTPTSAAPDVEPPRNVRPPGPPGPPSRTSPSGSPDAARAREGINQEPQAGAQRPTCCSAPAAARR